MAAEADNQASFGTIVLKKPKPQTYPQSMPETSASATQTVPVSVAVQTLVLTLDPVCLYISRGTTIRTGQPAPIQLKYVQFLLLHRGFPVLVQFQFLLFKFLFLCRGRPTCAEVTHRSSSSSSSCSKVTHRSSNSSSSSSCSCSEVI
ncbi:hypothetical protein Q5P01_000255 [Channa striata]|uniref:Uncharacterized protein n=1 Tax=Channa striata TaxID=64152 RepID=A0AA88IJU4_CHASR|nr:hypothetical protein Q5P01_000255 [Channa striata]